MSKELFSRHFRPVLFKEIATGLLSNLERPAVYAVDFGGYRFSVFVVIVPVVSELAQTFNITYRYGYRITPLPNNPEALKAGIGGDYMKEKETTDNGVDPVKLEAVVNAVVSLFYKKLEELDLTESVLSPEVQDLPTEFTFASLGLIKEEAPALEIVK